MRTRNMKPKQQRTKWLVAAVVAVGTTVAGAEEVTIKQPAASVLSGKTARSGKVAQLSAGDKVQVLGREGSWLKVKAGNTEGYLHENSIGSGGGGGGLSEKIANMSGASAASSGEAGRGVGDSAANWAGSKSMNTSGLTRMVAVRNALNDSDWQKFTANGTGGTK
jgi:hypothetical protein